LKLIIGIIILIVAINGFAFYNLHRTTNHSEEIIDTLEILRKTIEQEDWKKTPEVIQELEKKWEQADAWWTPLMDHREIDLLEQTIVRVVQNIEVRQKQEALVEIALAKRMTKKIMEKEQPYLKNIF